MAKVFLNPELKTIFDRHKDEYSYESMRNLMTDRLNNNLEDGVTNEKAEKAIRGFVMEVFGLTKDQLDSQKYMRRAIRHNSERFFEVMEDVLEDRLVQGWNNDPFFMQFVEQRNVADGDSLEFYTEEEVRLAVHRVSGDHHDFTVQRLGKGQKFTVDTVRYGAAVGTDIRQYLLGRVDFTKLVDAIYKAFDQKIKQDIYAELAAVGTKLPVPAMFNKAIPTTDEGKEVLDQLLEDVSVANGNAEVYIMGTSAATKKLEKFHKVDWLSEDEKSEKYRTGRVGFYEGHSVIEIPQQMIKSGDTLNRLIATDQLLVFPASMDKFIKFVNAGNPQIYEKRDIGDYEDDSMYWEYTQSFGAQVVVGKYFGNVKLTAGA